MCIKKTLGKSKSFPESYDLLAVQPWIILYTSQIISLLYKMGISLPALSAQLYSIMQILDFVLGSQR